MHETRHQLAVDGNVVPLKALRIGNWWHFGAREVAIRRVRKRRTTRQKTETYLCPQNP
jgi:hypothetical protein